MTSSGSKTCREGELLSPLIRSSRRCKAADAISVIGCRTTVSAGWKAEAQGKSSMLVTDMFPGTETRASARARITPISIRLLATKSAVGRCGRAKSSTQE